MKKKNMIPQQNDDTVGGEAYVVGYDLETARFFQNRRAASHAAFFLSHLHPGMSLLDCGCGPGTITLDLAEHVAPGEVMGIDKEHSQIDIARMHAASQGLSNLRFETHDIYHIPFSDASFDAVFSHGVLEHLRQPLKAVIEMRRILKVGGVVGFRHADWGGFILEPMSPPLHRFPELFEKLMVHCGGDPRFGRHQTELLRAAGFEQIEVSASFDCWTQNREATFDTAQFLARLCKESEFSEQIIQSGLAERSILNDMNTAFKSWGQNPNAFAAEAWVEAVAWK